MTSQRWRHSLAATKEVINKLEEAATVSPQYGGRLASA